MLWVLLLPKSSSRWIRFETIRYKGEKTLSQVVKEHPRLGTQQLSMHVFFHFLDSPQQPPINGTFQTSRNCVWLETVSSYVSDFAVLAQGLRAVGNVETARSSICPTLDQICPDAAKGTKEWPLTHSVANLVEQLQDMLQMLAFFKENTTHTTILRLEIWYEELQDMQHAAGILEDANAWQCNVVKYISASWNAIQSCTLLTY